MISIAAPALITDLAATIGGKGRVYPIVWHVAKLQLASGPSWAIRDAAGDTLMVGGIYLSDDLPEAWFSAAPAASHHMLAVVRAMRLTLAATPYRVIRTAIATNEGRRIARSTGFVVAGVVDGIEVWELYNGQGGQVSVRRRQQRRGEAGARTGSGTAADAARIDGGSAGRA